MNELEKYFEEAYKQKKNYVAVIIEMDGFEKPELIVNQFGNIHSKLNYYKKTYDENLNHKFSKGIRIIGFTSGNTLEELNEEYIKYLKK